MTTQADSLRQAGVAAMKAGNIDEAIQYFHQSISANADSYETCAYLGAAYAQQQNFEGSRRMFGRCVQLNPNSAKARFNLGSAHQKAGDNNAARVCFEAALKIDPGYANAQAALSKLPAAEFNMASLSSPGGSHNAGSGYHAATDANDQAAPIKPSLMSVEDIAKLNSPSHPNRHNE